MLSVDKKRWLLLLMLMLLLISMMIRAEPVYMAARRGLELWWNAIAPALLPFFIISELLLGSGLAAMLAPPLSRLMRPLFYLPGAAALPVLMGFCSGFPTGAIITAGLRREGGVSAAEGARLIAFTNNAGPLYITVSIAIGLLSYAQAAWILAIVHYGGNLLLGVSLGLLARWRGEPCGDETALPPVRPAPVSPGRTLKNAAQSSVNNILLIGCYMVFFSVLTAVMDKPLAQLSPVLHALAQGFWEMSLGIDLLTESGLDLSRILPAAAAILALGGVSVQAQVAAMVADTDISPRLYLACRLIHTAFSYVAARALCGVISLPAAVLAAPMEPPQPFATACLLCAAALLLWLLMSLFLSPAPNSPLKKGFLPRR